METETNELGEVYEWEYIAPVLLTWEEADDEWDSISANKPWDYYGNGGGWRMRTERTLSFSDSTSRVAITSRSVDILRFGDIELTNNKNDYAIQQVEIKDGKSSLAEIRNIALNQAPYGYEEIRPLVPGEYTYEKALVGIRLRKNTPDAVIGFEGAVLNVDVEDVVDKGTVTISDNPSTGRSVTYNKWYYKKPEELMFSVENYTEPCVVEVLTSDARGFTIRLKSTVNANTYVTGTVHWLSNGY